MQTANTHTEKKMFSSQCMEVSTQAPWNQVGTFKDDKMLSVALQGLSIHGCVNRTAFGENHLFSGM